MTAKLLIPVILQVVGIIVLIAEIILPSFGVLTVLAVGLLGYSLYLVFTGISASAGILFVLADIIILPIILFMGIKLLARSPVTLKTTLSKTNGYSSQSEELTAYMGQTGTAISDLRPSGTARIGGARVDVISRGEYIDKNSPLTVIAVDGNRVVVRKT